MNIDSCWPGSRFGSWQLTVLVSVWKPQTPTPPVEENATPEGSGSVSVTAVAVEGPPLDTVIWKLSGVPAVTGFGVADLVTLRLDWTVTVVSVCARSLALLPSKVALETRASLCRIPVVRGLTVALIVIVDEVAPAARVPASQVVG